MDMLYIIQTGALVVVIEGTDNYVFS
jgi:hypothetical protein